MPADETIIAYPPGFSGFAALFLAAFCGLFCGVPAMRITSTIRITRLGLALALLLALALAARYSGDHAGKAPAAGAAQSAR